MYDSDKALKNWWDFLSTLVHQPRKFRGQRQSSPPAADTDSGPPPVHSSRPDACQQGQQGVYLNLGWGALPLFQRVPDYGQS